MDGSIEPFIQNYLISLDRLTRVQLLFTRNLSPIQSIRFSFVFLLLPPRSALQPVSPGLTPWDAPQAARPPTHRGLSFAPMVEYKWGTLTQRSDHPASPVLLTRNGPLTTTIRTPGSIKQLGGLTHLKFENRSRTLHPRGL